MKKTTYQTYQFQGQWALSLEQLLELVTKTNCHVQIQNIPNSNGHINFSLLGSDLNIKQFLHIYNS